MVQHNGPRSLHPGAMACSKPMPGPPPNIHNTHTTHNIQHTQHTQAQGGVWSSRVASTLSIKHGTGATGGGICHILELPHTYWWYDEITATTTSPYTS